MDRTGSGAGVVFDEAAWHKSSRSNGNGDCVEVAPGPEVVGVRDSKDRSGLVLTFSPGSWTDFLLADHPQPPRSLRAGGRGADAA